jgi:hypothetical protein
LRRFHATRSLPSSHSRAAISGHLESGALACDWLSIAAKGILSWVRSEDSPMACEDLLAGCFMDEQAPLAVPEFNRERALKYL